MFGSLGIIIDRFKVKRASLQFVRGTWDAKQWGPHPSVDAPGGASIWALVPEANAVATWDALRRALGGVYRGSLGAIDTAPAMTAALAVTAMATAPPAHAEAAAKIMMKAVQAATQTAAAARGSGSGSSSSGGAAERLLYGHLPREAVCTENIAPVVAQLPCRGRVGLGALLDPTRIVGASYYSAAVAWDVVFARGAAPPHTLTPTSVVLTHTVVAVFGDAATRVPPARGAVEWSLAALFAAPARADGRSGARRDAAALRSRGSAQVRACALSAESTVTVHVPHWAGSKGGSSGGIGSGSSGGSSDGDVDGSGGGGNSSSGGSRGCEAPQVTTLELMGDATLDMVEIRFQAELPPPALRRGRHGSNCSSSSSSSSGSGATVAGGCDLEVDHFLAGRGGTSGDSHTRVACSCGASSGGGSGSGGNSKSGGSSSSRSSDGSGSCHVTYLQAVPPFLVPLFHTLHVRVGSQDVSLEESASAYTVGASAGAAGGGGSGSGSGGASTVISLGVGEDGAPSLLELRADIPAGEELAVSFKFLKRFLAVDAFPPDPARGFDVPPPLVTCGGRHYSGAAALVDLPYPDFSMPFNVVTLTCTLVAFFAGTALNVLVRKSEWRGGGGGGGKGEGGAGEGGRRSCARRCGARARGCAGSRRRRCPTAAADAGAAAAARQFAPAHGS
ncbi:Gpi16 subunit, GPI transamidase component-domain-containing protein [Tribonema minus]|uniref:Gpi16 subunit, GPI transamidase component-domain-containing protein n=1 Tax=Tribonema minus TaxID=303371 RepID=A0A835ZF54_9STRA|nr:Gpi16 subunit, GPI transamidase component-domain-containing protein [Tribonema minus]